MKKIMALLALSAIAAGTAFAHISFSGQVLGRADLAANFSGLGGGSAFAPEAEGGVAATPEGELRRRFSQHARLIVSAQNMDATFGGSFRMWFPSMRGPDGQRTHWDQDQPYSFGGSSHFHGFVWWSPRPGLRVTIGEDQWGRYGGTAQIVGAAFNNGSGDALLNWGAAGEAHYGTSWRRSASGGGGWDDRMGRVTGFYPGFGIMGISAQFTPLSLPELTLIATVPFGLGNSPRPGHGWMQGEDTGDLTGAAAERRGWLSGMLHSTLSVRYAIDGIGTVAFTVVGGPGYWGNRDTVGPSNALHSGNVFDARLNGGGNGGNRANSPKFYLSFFAPGLVENMQFNIGVAYTAPFSIPGDSETNTAQRGWTHHFPIELGLGVQYAAGAFSARLRFAQMFLGGIDRGNLGATEAARGRIDAPPITGAGIHLSYNFGFLRASLNVGTQILWDHFEFNATAARGGAGLTGNSASDGFDGAIGWYATPYISMPIANAHIFAGFHMETNGVRQIRPETHHRPIDNAPDIAWRIPVALVVSF